MPMLGLSKQPALEPEVLSALNEYGTDGVRSILTGMTDGRAGTGLGAAIRLGSTNVSRKEMQDWLNWKNARQALWNGVGIVAAVLAAAFSFAALLR
jgi:hypothetical protein